MPRRPGLSLFLGLSALIAAAAAPAQAQDVGCVSTVWKMVGPDHKICVEAFEDPQVDGVVCHVSRARTGGIGGALGLAEDTSDAAIACRQVGPITIKEELKEGEEVFSERRSVMFKRLQVVRFLDEAHSTLVYLVYSDELVEGSPKNSLSTVPIMPWGGVPAKGPGSD